MYELRNTKLYKSPGELHQPLHFWSLLSAELTFLKLPTVLNIDSQIVHMGLPVSNENVF